MLNYYNKVILPKKLNKEMGDVSFNATRESVASNAYGTVLEIGFGSGYNLPFYKNIERLYALEPSKELYSYSNDRQRDFGFHIVHLNEGAEKISLDDNSVDSVVSTWTMCSIEDLSKALKEIRRVLKPEGKLLFVEHGKSSNKLFYAIQNIFTKVSKNFTGNCHLDRDIKKFIINTGFELERIELEQEDGRPLMYSYQGVAINRK